LNNLNSFTKYIISEISEISEITEMADITGIVDPKSYNKEQEWNKNFKDTDSAVLLLDKIGANHYKLYRVGNAFFFLTNENDKYLGQLKMKVVDKVGTISTSNSKLPKGFYNIIFTSLLGSGIVNEIISGNQLSIQALKSYINLDKLKRFNIQVITHNEYIPFSEDAIKDHYDYKISVKEKKGFSVQERFKSFYEKISEEYTINGVIIPSPSKSEFLNYNSCMDNFLFGENFVNELEIHETLNPKLWDKDLKLKPEVNTAIDKIAKNFITFLGIDIKKIQNIIFTGSNANYNYHNGSDIDIHIEVDTTGLTCVDINDYLRTKKTLWNEQHNITIYGYDVELYAEPTKDAIVSSAGVYSTRTNKWIKEPTKINEINIDEPAIKLKVDLLKKQMDDLMDSKADDMKSLQKMKDGIHNMRVHGINNGGEYSVENLAFKELRDSGYIEKFWAYVLKVEDNSLSLK
jgi:hypothetical protein